jgi:hypothetical protein
MSRNSKSARRVMERKQWSAMRKGGGRGPAQTEPKHGKRRAWFQLYDSHGDYVAAQKKGGKRQQKEHDEESASTAQAQ